MKGIISLVLVLILIIVGFILLNQPENEPVVDEEDTAENTEVAQENYTNSEFGISFSYPGDWEVVEAVKPTEIRALHEIVVWESEPDPIYRPSLSIFVFFNEDGLSLEDWWQTWLDDENKEKEACVEEYADTAPCLFLPDRIEDQKETTLAGKGAIKVKIFEFDREKQCTHTELDEEYIVSVCRDSQNPNDPNEKTNLEIYSEIENSLSF